MPRRSRDSESESEASDSEVSGSESGTGSGTEGYDYDSGSGSDDSSGDDWEDITGVLKDAGLKKYVKVFEKNDITTVDDALDVTEKQLKKLGVTDSKDRKKIIQELEELGSDYDSESDDEEAIKECLKAAGLKKQAKYLFENDITTWKDAQKLTESKLKKYGVKDSKDRSAIIKALSKNAEVDKALKKAGVDVATADVAALVGKEVDEKDLKKAGVDKADRKTVMKVLNKVQSEGGSESESGSEGGEGSVIKKLLAKANMKRYYSLFEKKGITSLSAAKKLEHKDLREMGIHLYRERRDILEEFSKYNGEELPTASSGSGEEEEDNSNMVHEVLRQQYMSRHIPDFDRMGITTLRQARKLTQTQLRSMGVALYLQRERLINAFADYRPKNKAIMKILVDCNLASHAREFEKLIDVEDAKNLTHSDLRAMGINLYGQRERLMRAFMEYKK